MSIELPAKEPFLIANKRIGFPVVGVPKAIGTGAPAWGARYIIDPNDDDVRRMDEEMLRVATDKWKEDAKDILQFLKEQKKVAFEHAPYRSSTTGKVYGGFEGKFNLGTRSEKTKMTVLDRSGTKILENSEREALIYSGCYVTASVEFWAQDNQYGKRINCTTLGIMFMEHGDSFGGGSAPADADHFAKYAKKADAADLL